MSILSRLLLGAGEEQRLPATRRASFAFYGKIHFWKLLLCGVMTSAFFLPLILLALLPMFYVGFAALALSCYCNRVFDRYINPALGEKYAGIGLRKE